MIMTEVERIGDQLNRAFDGEAWHGPAVLEILKEVSAEQAAARPFNEAHSIWELVFHIEAWVRAGRRRLSGDRAQLVNAEDWPAVTDTSDQAWADAQDALKQAHDELCSVISLLDETRLEEPIIEGMSSVYVTLHGVIQHTLYHAGQIAILKRAIAERGPA
jgi:uncharacterized damage-inducible protein DinB